MQQFDKSTCKTLSHNLAAALAEFAKANGIQIIPAGGAFSPAEYTMKLRIRLTGEAADEAARAEWNLYTPQLGIDRELFGATFTNDGHEFTVCGIAVTRSTFPIKARRDDGKILLFKTDVLRRAKVAA